MLEIVCGVEPETIDLLVQFGRRQCICKTVHQFLCNPPDSRDGIGGTRAAVVAVHLQFNAVANTNDNAMRYAERRLSGSRPLPRRPRSSPQESLDARGHARTSGRGFFR
jgi:hypothetical protein